MRAAWGLKGGARGVLQQPTRLSAGADWRELPAQGQPLSLLLQQLTHVHHLSGGHGFGSAVGPRPPNSVAVQKKKQKKKPLLSNSVSYFREDVRNQRFLCRLTVCSSADSPPHLHTWSSSCFSLARA